jgi:hypothetical protein
MNYSLSLKGIPSKDIKGLYTSEEVVHLKDTGLVARCLWALIKSCKKISPKIYLKMATTKSISKIIFLTKKSLY